MTLTVNPDLRGAALAQATAEYIAAHPEEWNQDTWGSKTECGTTACFAGTAVLIAGAGRWLYGMLWTNEAVEGVGEVAADLLGRSYYGDDETWNLFQEPWHVDEDGVLLPLDDRLKEMWRRVAALFPEGAIKIPAEYR